MSENVNYMRVLEEQPAIIWAPMVDGVVIPTYAEPGAAGMDIRSYMPPGTRVQCWSNVTNAESTLMVDPEGVLTIVPRCRVIIPTGLRCVVRHDLELQIRPRSGFIKTTLRMVNNPGTVDSSYRGEIGVLVENISDHALVGIRHNDRVCQGILATVIRAPQTYLPPGSDVAALYPTDRGAGAFGSTGKQ